MIHVMNPYQMSVAMFRLTSLGLEFQTQMMKTLTQMAMAPLAGMPEDEEEVEEAPAQATATARKATKTASRSRGATKAGTTRARKTRKPSAPPTMPEPAGQTSAAEEGEATDNMPV